MNREVKFRLWDTNENEFVQPSQIAVKGNGEVMADTGKEWVYDIDKSDFILMQYTGLKDKNGKEIYEGDIVEQEKWISVGKYTQTIAIIKYSGVGFTCDCIGDWEGSNAVLNGNAVVIGNIYSNPELLSNENK